MKKLMKYLKPYRMMIFVIFIMVAITSMAYLYLPDRMSDIVGEGITSEVIYEETEEGNPIYLQMGETEIQLPKFICENEGILVTNEINGKNYAIIVGVETDELGNTIQFINPQTQETTPIPKFLRTIDGNASSEVKQGKLVLDKDGNIQIKMVQKSNFAVIWKNGIIMLIVTLVASILSIFVSKMSSIVGNGFGRDLRSKLFGKVISFSQAQEDKFSTASLITRSTNDVTQIMNLTIMGLRMIINVPVMFIGGFIMAYNKDPKMTLIIIIVIPIVALVVGIVAKFVIPIFKTIQSKIDAITRVSRENITGVRVIRAFGGEKYEDKRFAKVNKSVTDASLKAARIISTIMPAMMFIMSMTSIAIVLVTVNTVNNGLQAGTLDFTQIGNMMAVIQYVMLIMMSVIMVSIIFIMVPRASVSANRINEVLDINNDIVDPDSPIYPEKKGTIDFENVCFSFSETASENVLDNINFSLNKGSITSIIGGTGSGKSTLINLIPRQYDVTSGIVRVDGEDVRNFSLKELRSRIGFVTQNAIIFSGNIKDNILMDNANENNLQQAIAISQSEEFIFQKEGGIEAVVEQGGENFSGGQKQRISIARALAKDSEILIFDDSFSALDFATDARLRKELKKIIKDKTVIIVAQRIGTVMDSDKIIVLDKGKVVGIGKHQELINDCEEYRDIALSQLSEEELGLKGDNNYGK